MTQVLIVVAFLAGGVAGVFVTLVIGIRADERHLSLKSEPRSNASASTRRLLAHVRRPDDNDITKFAALRRDF